MRIIIQRCLDASVSVDNRIIGKIDKGLTILVGFTEGDNQDVINKMINKVINLRIFDDEHGVMNKSLIDVNQSILSISQFTLYASTKKGRRPSYDKALNSLDAIKLYDIWNENLRKENIKVETGEFGADMKVSLINDGPVTIFIDSDE